MAFAEAPVRRSPYRLDLRVSPSQRHNNARDDRDVDPLPLAPIGVPRTSERQQDYCAPGYHEPSGSPTLSSANARAAFQTISQADSVAPRLPSRSSSPLRRPATLSPASDNSRQEELETCQLDEPGCYVLVPTSGQNPDDNNRSNEAKHYRDKKNPTKKGYRKPMDESERQAIKLNRKVGVCLRCKLFKEKCRGGIPCDRCSSLKVWKSICVPAQFTEKAVFNRAIYRGRVSALLDNIRVWNPESNFIPSSPEHIDVHNGYGLSLKLTAHSFVPYDETLLDHILWRVVGKPGFNRLPSTCYGLKEELGTEILDDYIDKHLESLVNEEMTMEVAGICSPIHALTIKSAYDYAHSNKNLSPLVRKALRIWIVQNFFFNSPWRMCGHNSLGMNPIDDPTSKLHGVTPLPRLINQQLDFYLEDRISTLEKELLAELQSRILDRNSYDWFGIFLTIYIYLSSMERDTWSLHTWENDADMLTQRVHELELQNPHWPSHRSWVWPISDSPMELMSKNEHLAEMLAYHFRTISKGYVPFTLDWDSKQVVQMAGCEREAVDYMKMMNQEVLRYESYLLARVAAQYSRENSNSLSGRFSSKLMLSKD
ncbi:hypothetical protein K440DRAFT_550521 [Wilcoxina mikolae CBS 423.85]|nr:hypothetical protein K440DRAFT_550521 [Wilcoxina mikolae CBS 423.85]